MGEIYSSPDCKSLLKNPENFMLYAFNESVLNAFAGQKFFLFSEEMKENFGLNLTQYMSGEQSILLRLSSFKSACEKLD